MYTIVVKNNRDHMLSTHDRSEINKLYKECFNQTDGFDDEEDHDECWITYFMLLDKDKRLVGFFKIVHMNMSYEVYDVCRANPAEPCRPKMMVNFMNQSLEYFDQNLRTTDNTFLLAVRTRDNTYRKQSIKLYTRLGFIRVESCDLEYDEGLDDDVEVEYYRRSQNKKMKTI
jgi:hypothetical protein